MIDELIRKPTNRRNNCIFYYSPRCGESNGKRMNPEDIEDADAPCGFQNQEECDRAEFPIEFEDSTLPEITTLLGEPAEPLPKITHLLADIKGYIETGYDRNPDLVLDLTCTIEALFEREFPELTKR